MTQYLYLLLNIGSISVPFIFSFHPKLKFYKMWPALGLSIIINMMVFIPWDHVFTINGFWGFDANYLCGISLYELPIEEWLFFICIPYACVFMHHAILVFHKEKQLPVKLTNSISACLFLFFTALVIMYWDRWYSVINFSYGIILLTLVVWKRNELLRHYYVTFLFMLIPFIIVNGILTGTELEDPIVWYNNIENMGIRLGTIPVEDTTYAFTLILGNLVLTEYFFLKFKSQKPIDSVNVSN